MELIESYESCISRKFSLNSGRKRNHRAEEWFKTTLMGLKIEKRVHIDLMILTMFPSI